MYIQLLSWNTNFCGNCIGKSLSNPNDMSVIKKWSDFTVKLIQEDYDFILLQETNPFFALLMQEKEPYSPNPNYCDDKKCGPKYLKYGNKNIYYHGLSKVLTEERPNDLFWGTAIITKEKTKNIKTYFYDEKNEYTGSDYFGYESVMFYDFQLENDVIVTIINFYKKGDACKAKYVNGKCINYDVVYRYDDNFFEDIHEINNKNNIIIFAGDFNLAKKGNDEYDNGGIIQRIEDFNFINKTKDIGKTMSYDNQNDYLFVNSKFSDNINISNVRKILPPYFPDFIDHFKIECKIKI